MSNILARPLADRLSSLPAPRDHHDGTVTPEAAINGAVQALDDGKTKYTNRPGIVPLREWVANHVNETYHMNLAANDITITCGITEAEYVTLTYFTTHTPGHILVADDTDDHIYLEHVRPIAQMNGTDAIPHDAPDDEIAVVYIGGDGAQATAAMHHAQEHNLPVVWSTGMNANDIELSNFPDLIPNTVIVGGFERTLHGWRIGWMAGHAEHGKLRSYKQSMTICTPSVSQWAALAMLEAQS